MMLAKNQKTKDYIVIMAKDRTDVANNHVT